MLSRTSVRASWGARRSGDNTADAPEDRVASRPCQRQILGRLASADRVRHRSPIVRRGCSKLARGEPRSLPPDVAQSPPPFQKLLIRSNGMAGPARATRAFRPAISYDTESGGLEAAEVRDVGRGNRGVSARSAPDEPSHARGQESASATAGACRALEARPSVAMSVALTPPGSPAAAPPTSRPSIGARSARALASSRRP